MALTVSECKAIISQERKQLTEAQRRIAQLELLASDLYAELGSYWDGHSVEDADWLPFKERMAELGLLGDGPDGQEGVYDGA